MEPFAGEGHALERKILVERHAGKRAQSVQTAGVVDGVHIRAVVRSAAAVRHHNRRGVPVRKELRQRREQDRMGRRREFRLFRHHKIRLDEDFSAAYIRLADRNRREQSGQRSACRVLVVGGTVRAGNKIRSHVWFSFDIGIICYYRVYHKTRQSAIDIFGKSEVAADPMFIPRSHSVGSAHTNRQLPDRHRFLSEIA